MTAQRKPTPDEHREAYERRIEIVALSRRGRRLVEAVEGRHRDWLAKKDEPPRMIAQSYVDPAAHTATLYLDSRRALRRYVWQQGAESDALATLDQLLDEWLEWPDDAAPRAGCRRKVEAVVRAAEASQPEENPRQTERVYRA